MRIRAGYNRAAAMGVSKAVEPLVRLLSGAGRLPLFAAIAKAEAVTIDDHLNRYARSHHKTAQRMGGTTTRVLESAKVDPVWTSEGGAVTVSAVGIGRALHPVEIRPKTAKALTIPVSGYAYGRRVKQLIGFGWTVWCPKNKHGQSSGLLLGKSPAGFTAPLYVLAKRARIPHEPGMLPDDATLAKAAARGALTEIERVMRG